MYVDEPLASLQSQPCIIFYLVDLPMYLRPLGGVVVVVVLLKNRIARFRKFLIA